jgi:hypothetical protein
LLASWLAVFGLFLLRLLLLRLLVDSVWSLSLAWLLFISSAWLLISSSAS